MSTIHLDFKDMSLANSFPQHGWALNSKGRKLLWLPIMNVMVNVEEVRQKRGIAELLNKTVAHADHFIQTLAKLAICLRELGKIDRTSSQFLNTRPEVWTEENHRQLKQATELAGVFIESAYSYLRRLADQFAVAIRPAIFRKPDRIPPDFLKLRKLVLNDVRLAKEEALVDRRRLQELFRQQTSWFDKLRHPSGGDKGLRDAFEHGQWSLMVGWHSPMRDGLSMDAHLEKFGYVTNDGQRILPQPDPDLHEYEFIGTLKKLMAQLCVFYSRTCQIIGWRDGYSFHEKGECLYMVGDDEDICCFWPEIHSDLPDSLGSGNSL